ncbi:MAG: transglutaminase family protein [Nannocystaceae bacterium]|nr:transglutaminase-like domain-containing protein [bacterium]
MSGSGFLQVATAEPFPSQLMRALEALAETLQQGHAWPGHAERLAELESLAASRTRDAVAQEDHLAASLALMGLLREQGFGGAGPTYERVDNSFIDRVLETGHGLPITLSALAIHLAQTQGIPLRGIGFPGHFIVGIGLDGPSPTVFDPFGGGEALSFSTLAELYTRATGRHLTASAPMLRDALQPASTRSILVRVCNNLHHHYLRRGSHDRAADVVELLAVLHPRGAALRQLATRLERRVRTLN